MSNFIRIPGEFNRVGGADTIINIDKIVTITVYEDQIFVQYLDDDMYDKFSIEAAPYFGEDLNKLLSARGITDI